MVIVNAKLVERFYDNELIKRAMKILENDPEIQTLHKMSNVFAVTRLNYNDHGPTHARIMTGASLEIFRLARRIIGSTIVKDNIGTLEDAELVVTVGAYLHDIGNSIHRDGHPIHGVMLSIPILDRILSKIYESRDKSETELYKLRQEILHVIYSHDENIQCLTVEAGSVKVGDGLDMAEGRARVPYERGRVSIHSVSALSIRRVFIRRGRSRPIHIVVEANNPSGIFQVEVVLGRKISTSGLAEYIEVEYKYGKESKIMTF